METHPEPDTTPEIEIETKIKTETKTETETETKIKIKTNDATKNLFVWFRILGIIMPKKHKALYVVYSIFVQIGILIVFPLSFPLSYFYAYEKWQINAFLTSVELAVNTYACGIKFICIALMRENLFKIEAILDRLDSRIKYPEEIREAQRAMRMGNRVLLGFFLAYYLYSGVTVLGALIVGRPPYSLYNPFINWTESKPKYYITVMMEAMGTCAICFQEVSNDAYAVIYVSLSRSHLKLLVMRVLRIGSDPTLTKEQNQKELVNCIHDHKHIIELLDAVAPVISPTVFVQFIATTMDLGAALINISISSDKSTAFSALTFFFGIVMEIFPICYSVNSLVAEAERLPQAIFHMNWIDQSYEFRKLCLFFMHRSQQDVVFYAGKFFPITLNTFVGIIKFSFSVYTLFSNMDIASTFK